MRTTVDLNAVESLDGRKAEPPPVPVVKVQARSGLGAGAQVRTSRNTLDIRGMRVHEAESTVEEQLRNANGPLWVIHGIGTGKLKRGLRAWLDTVPYVERVVDAEQGDGGLVAALFGCVDALISSCLAWQQRCRVHQTTSNRADLVRDAPFVLADRGALVACALGLSDLRPAIDR
jgi:hypothetical protein